MEYQQYLDAHQDRFVEEYLEFLRFPSISALPEHAPDVRRAAEWVANRVVQAGLENAEVMETGGHPVVYGDWLHAPGQPTVLIYGHLDVQPVDPLDLWNHPPFEPRLAGDQVSARGASDSKGNMFPTIVALEGLLQSEGRLPVNVKLCYEGQEEIGSPQISDFLARYKEKFACDIAVSSDGGQFDADQPSLTVALRGICAVQVDITGPSRDLHSGSYGGAVCNPIHELAAMLAGLHHRDGSVAVPGFYDRVREATAEERAQTAAVPFSEEEFLTETGAPAVFGAPGYTTRERIWHRPTLEINGVWGGYREAGIKTVLPSRAGAKITCRLVADQDPEEIRKLLIDHLTTVVPEGVTVEAQRLSMDGKPYEIPSGNRFNRIAAEVLTEEYGKTPVYLRAGGSIPITGCFRDHLGVHTVNFGFGLKDELAHSPNEFFRLSSFRRSQRLYARLLRRMAIQ
ncbi:MAG: dipeptidase [Caldilineaceae bacterium SB0665_bin_21]|nr:dipeptidase [Caldilineaceae bacterium SB0665_bin_21]MYA04588.1 dipeptidase [Caldilineaceae bacterium SB0664_bin_22]MYC61243.1 dipeptidase [Caldilineaceae bacterium SB0661_bin_34]